jgi:transposase
VGGDEGDLGSVGDERGDAALVEWVRQTEVDAGEAPGVSTDAAREIRELRRMCRENRIDDRNPQRRNEFLRAECDALHR